ncbi:MAG TPA: FAD:protein FMN transferase [Vicinamibacterales bacterium]|nr:FAD:protein FMN transferase [Vicinamibacterales bacterium]
MLPYPTDMPGTADGYGRADGPGRRPTDVDGGLGIEGPGDLREVRRFSHEAMATVFEVHGVHPDQQYAAQAAQAAFDLVDRLERELSRFLPNSDIARVNRLAAGEHTRVAPSTLECLVIARHVFDLTGGAFDVSIGTGLTSLDLDADNFLVRATTKGGVQVDLGGIGKGYAVDRMAELLEEWGVGRALVHGGFSSVLALEPPAGREGWPLTLSDPGAPSRVLARLSVRQAAVGASGLRKGDHIVDPRTGDPVRGRLAAWVAVPRPQAARTEAAAGGAPRVAAAAVTDALTTAFMLLDADEIEALCERSPGLEAWVLPEPAGESHGETPLLHFGALQD